MPGYRSQTSLRSAASAISADFTHHFSRIVGLSPAAWRRALNQ